MIDKKVFIGGGVVLAALVYFGTRKGQAGDKAALATGPATAIQGDSIHLIKDRYYAGRMHLKSSSPTPFTLGATSDVISKGLRSLGFEDVSVFMKREDLPENLRYLAEGSDENCRWFKAKWPNLTSDMPKPENLVQLFISAPPKALGA